MDKNIVFPARRYDLDWLRVLAILAVFVFHTTRFFDPMDWHVKNATTFQPLEISAALFTLWGMPLIFLVSGASIFFALKRSWLEFVKERVLRLLVPLLVGIFTFSMLQVYLERTTHGQFYGSFIEFIPHYFEGWYPFYGGNFAWMGMHLWYLELLFLYSVMLLPLLIWLKRGGGQALLNALGKLLALPGLVYLFALPVVLLLVVLDPQSILGAPSFGGWSPIPFIWFLVAGFVIMSSEGIQKRMLHYRWLSLGIAAMLTLGLLVTWQRLGTIPFGTMIYTLFYTTYGLAAWCWIQAVLGFSFKYLNAPRPILAYVGEAVLPFYILHQTVLLLVGYFVVQLQIPDLLKWALIAWVSFGSILLLYEFVIRRVNVLRFLYGMKVRSRSVAPLTTMPSQQAINAPKAVH